MQMLLSNNLYLLHGKILDRQAWWCLCSIMIIVVIVFAISQLNVKCFDKLLRLDNSCILVHITTIQASKMKSNGCRDV